MMKTTKTTKLDLFLPDLEDIINEYLVKIGYSELDGKKFHFHWKVVNKPREFGIYDSVDNYVFGGVEVTITEE